ncbi:MAG: cytidylate kinase-like family protein [Balneolia bacterium]|nr:cytidylate kinase-like family protein [Balneolia bacterium]
MRSKLTPKPRKSVSDYVEEIKRTNKLKSSSTASASFPTITISREFGCEGFPLAKAIIQKLSGSEAGWELYSRDLINAISEESDLLEELYDKDNSTERNKLFQDLQELLNVAPSDYTRYKELAQNVCLIGEQGRAVIVGSGASILAQKETNFFNVRVTGSFAFRSGRIAKELNVSQYEAERIVTEQSSKRVEFIQKFSRQDISDPSLYHLVFRNDHFNADQMADLIVEAMKKIGML